MLSSYLVKLVIELKEVSAWQSDGQYPLWGAL